MTPILVFMNELQGALEAIRLSSNKSEIVNNSVGLATVSLRFHIGRVECDVAVMWDINQGDEKIKYVLPRKYKTLRPLNITFRLDHDWSMGHIHTTVIHLEEALKSANHDALFGFAIESGLSAHDAQAITVQHTEYIRESDVCTPYAHHRSRVIEMVIQNILFIGNTILRWFEEELQPLLNNS